MADFARKENMALRIVTFGEIMLRLSPPGFQRIIQARDFEIIHGGGESNVAVSLAHQGSRLNVSCLCLLEA
jgi:sugar/nucleoside kinase (ribokinase family)